MNKKRILSVLIGLFLIGLLGTPYYLWYKVHKLEQKVNIVISSLQTNNVVTENLVKAIATNDTELFSKLVNYVFPNGQQPTPAE